MKGLPKMNPTRPLIKSKMLLIRSPAKPKTDWIALRMVLKMPWKISKMEEMRLETPSTMPDMIAVFLIITRRYGRYLSLVGRW